MEVGSTLTIEGARLTAAVLRGSEALETLLDDGRVFAVVVGVHLDI